MPRFRHQALAAAILAGLLAVSGAASAKTWSGEMTLESALAVALDNNATFLGQKLSLDAKESDLAEARGRTGPSAKATLDETSGRIDDGLGPEVAVTLSQSVQAFHPLLDTAKYPMPLTATQLAGLSVQQYQAKLAKARADLVYSVTQAYYAVLKAKGLVEVQAAGVKAAEAARDDAKLKLDSGTGTKVDVLRAELEVANSQLALDKARNAVTQREAEFFALIGVDAPATEPSFATPAPVDEISTSLDDLLQKAITNRVDLVDSRLNVERASSAVKDARRGLLPTLSVSTGYTEDHVGAETSWEPLSGKAAWSLTLRPSEPSSTLGRAGDASGWESAISLSYPLFDSGVQKEVLRQSELDLKQAELTYGQAVSQVKSDVLTAYLALAETKNSLTALERALDQAKESQRLTDLRVRNGVGTTSELIDANRDLAKAQADLTQARFDYQLAIVRLRKAANLN